MGEQRRQVLLVNGDPLVMEGLALLLQDMHCEVMLVRDAKEFARYVRGLVHCPQLIIVAQLQENGVSGEHLIGEIQKCCRAAIPAILLASDQHFATEPAHHDNIVVFTDDLNPQRLRKLISELLGAGRAAYPA